MSTELVKIQPSPIPPLRQSTQECLSCPRFYVEVFIKGRRTPSGMDAMRGTEIHNTMSLYLSHCARKGVGMDLDAFDNFSRGAGPQAFKILSGLRDGYQVDYNNLFATEIRMALDENFQPTDIAEGFQGLVQDSGLPVAYEGTLDGLYMFRSENTILIDDFKSHVKPYEPKDKPQAKEYALFVFQHFPWVMTVKFRLTFVRYKRLTREVVFERSDVPTLIEDLRAARSKQIMVHDNYDAGNDIQPIGGSHCFYCHLLSNRTCPIAEYNENMQLTMEDRLSWDNWNSAFSRANKKVLRDYVQATGRRVVLRDYMGKSYVFDKESKESNVYPLFVRNGKDILTDPSGSPIMPIVGLLLTHREISPEDCDWLPNIVISSSKLESYLKASKRVITHNAVQDTAEKVTKVIMKVSKPLDVLPPDDFEDEDGDDGEFGEDTDF